MKMMTREERKQTLRDWMTATLQMEKVRQPQIGSADLAISFKGQFGIDMTQAWVNKALYGHKSKVPGKEMI
jgi:hypothetical protein